MSGCLNPCCNGRYSQSSVKALSCQTEDTVLILVVMEDTLRVRIKMVMELHCKSLNPCCNGRYSQRAQGMTLTKMSGCLNPCCNGRYSQSSVKALSCQTEDTVLILVVMEDTLRVRIKMVMELHCKSLNPCCNGRYSQRAQGMTLTKMSGCLNPCCNGRYSQRVQCPVHKTVFLSGCLNPCCNGRYSQSWD